jgi:hypothetical protein
MTTPSTQRRGARGRKLAASVALAGVTILTFPAVAQAAPGDPTPEQCFTFNAASGTITGFDTQCGDEVVIPSTLGGATVTTIGPNAFRGTGITGVTFPDTLQNIQTAAFLGTDLGDVVLPESIRVIGDFSFQDAGLTSITIPEGAETLGPNALVNNDLTTLAFPNSLRQIENGVVSNNPNLTSIAFGTPDYDSYQKWWLRGFTAADLGGEGLTDVYFGPAVHRISGFEGNRLTEVTVPGNGTNVETGAFRNNKITHVTVEDGAGTLYNDAFDLNPVETAEIKGSVYWLMASPFGRYRDRDQYANFIASVPDAVTPAEFEELEANWTAQTAQYTRVNVYDEELLGFYRYGWTDSADGADATRGFIVNASTLTANFRDVETGEAVADPYTSGAGADVADYRIVSNPAGDMMRYYRLDNVLTVTPPAVAGYAAAPAFQTELARGQNVVFVDFTPLAAPEGTADPVSPAPGDTPAPGAAEPVADAQVVATGGFDSTAATITAALALLLGAGGLGFFLLRRRGGGTPAV